MEGSGLSVRKCIVLIRNLPIDSATVAHLRGGQEFQGWDHQLYMLANLYDAVRENTYVTVLAHSKRKPPHPDPFPRPQETKKIAKKQTPGDSQFAAMARLAYRSGRKKD